MIQIDSIHGERCLDLKGARETLEDRLRDGKKVGNCDLHALLDVALNSDHYRSVLEDLSGALWSDDEYMREKSRRRLTDILIERHLDECEHLIREEAEEALREEVE